MLNHGKSRRRAWLRQLRWPGAPRRRTRLLGDLDDNAVGIPGVDKRLLPPGIEQPYLDRLDAGRLDSRQRYLDVGNDEVQVMRTRTPGGEEAFEERCIGAGCRRDQLYLRASGELQLAPPEAGGVTSLGPTDPYRGTH